MNIRIRRLLVVGVGCSMLITMITFFIGKPYFFKTEKWKTSVFEKLGHIYPRSRSRDILLQPKTATEQEQIPSNAHAKCKEKRHVIYVRIPKTGSSTMTHLIWRFGQDRGLRFLLPRPNIEGHQVKLTLKAFYLPNQGKHCDLMANTVMYSYENFKRYFPADVDFISLLRDPMSQLLSTIYYIKKIKNAIPGDNKISSYLRNPKMYEPEFGSRSFTHNPMMSYLGLAQKDFQNVSKIRQKIVEIDEKFAMVLILEKFEESLVLLKRKLCWTTKDIVYFVKNKNYDRPDVTMTSEDRKALKNWSSADYALYEHFSDKLDRSIAALAEEGFNEELSIFRAIQTQIGEFCKLRDAKLNLTISASKFSPSFQIPNTDCRLSGPVVLSDIRRKQRLNNFCN